MESTSETSTSTQASEKISRPSKGKVITQRILSGLGFLLFAVFASVQTNDVSQYGTAGWLTDTWLIGYSILSIFCLYNALRPLPSKIFLVLAIITFTLAIFRGSQINWNNPLLCITAPKDFAERNPAGNETGGLIIITIWLLLLCWSNKRIVKSKSITD